ncbi:hypothetical protein BACIH_0683 [Bacillus amyloliquefaciens]|nr:hypothetical protein BACIT_1023 [Bacillus amyloliquefaciens]QEY92461.1 hypothetical protein BACIH_0683 [Bacillus amyloliquefaciens]
MCFRGSKSIEKKGAPARGGALFLSAENNVNMSEREDCVLKKSNMTPWGRASATRFISKRRK